MASSKSRIEVVFEDHLSMQVVGGSYLLLPCVLSGCYNAPHWCSPCVGRRGCTNNDNANLLLFLVRVP